MKIFLSTGSSSPKDNRQRTLDRRGAPHRLVTFAETPRYKKAERERQKARGTKTVVAVNGLKGKRKKKSKPKSSANGFGLT